jgi:ABC-type methionine transport system permease subunit
MSWLQVEEAIIGVSKEWRSQCFLWGWSMHLPSWWEQKFLVVMGFVVNMVWAGLRGKVISTTTPPQLCQHPINSAIISIQVSCQMLVPFISLLIFFCLIKYAPKTRYH